MMDKKTDALSDMENTRDNRHPLDGLTQTNDTPLRPDDQDDIERFLDDEKNRIAGELAEIHTELTKLYNRLAAYMELLDLEIQEAADAGNERSWISLTGKKGILLQRLAELSTILRK